MHDGIEHSRKVAIFLGDLNGGGAERVALNLAEGLSAEGWNIDLIVGKLEGEYLDQLPSGIRLLSFDTRSIPKKAFLLRRYLKQEPPRVLLTFLARENSIALAVKPLAKAPTYFCAVEQSTPSWVLSMIGSLHRLLYRMSLRHLYPRADRLVAVSHGVAQDLAESTDISLSRIHVIHNPLIRPDVLERSRAPVDHPWLVDSARPKILLGMGRLDPQKDFLTLLSAFRQVRAVVDCRLLILGEGKLRHAIESRIREWNLKDAVDLPGFVENPYAWLAKADVFVLSSISEGFGNVLVEALACGTQVVSTDCPHGPSEVLAGGQFGRLVPMQDPAELARGILQAISHPLDPGLLRSRAKAFTQTEKASEYSRLIQGLF